MIYLDNAATTLIKPAAVASAAGNAMRTMASPGRGGHDPAMAAAETVLACREAAAELFRVPSPEQVVFTMNATHGLNIAIRSLARRGGRTVISGYEHNSVLRPLVDAGAKIIVARSPLFDRDDAIKSFEKEIPGSELVVCTHVSNVFGCVLPIYEIAQLCAENKVPLIVDASQSAGVLEVDFSRLRAAFIAMPGHKSLFGPQGTGILLCEDSGRPLMCGGSGSDSLSPFMPDYLPDRLEAGTHNVCGIAGLLEGIRFVRDRGVGSICRHERRLLSRFISQMGADDRYRLFCGEGQTGVISVCRKDTDCEELAMKLNEKGICVRSGIHCAPLAHETAGTIGTGTVRFSFSPFVCEEEIDYCCRILKEI